METHRRKADGRRIFTTAFKQEQVARLARQELTIAGLAREVSVSPQLIRQWQRLSTNGSAAAVDANEEVVPVREALATVAAARDLLGTDIQALMQRAVAARCGDGERPDAPIQWLSDNGSIYTALDTQITAERLHLVPITTPAASPQSNGMSEAFVNTLRRDYLAGADLSTAEVVLDQIPDSALGYQSPQQYRRTRPVTPVTC